MLALHGLLIIAACCIIAVIPAPARVYDQRQTGDLNVQIELKDLRVVALLDTELLSDYTDYDYFYDYADFTIKPGNKPTTVSSMGTTGTNVVTEITESPSSQSSTISASSDNINSTERSTILSTDPLNGTATSTSNANDNDKSQLSEENGSVTVPVAFSTTLKSIQALRSQKRCKSGYIPNGDGRCRRASRPWLSLL